MAGVKETRDGAVGVKNGMAGTSPAMLTKRRRSVRKRGAGGAQNPRFSRLA